LVAFGKAFILHPVVKMPQEGVDTNRPEVKLFSFLIKVEMIIFIKTIGFWANSQALFWSFLTIA